ncbi:hypothetical protein BT96DRAFT_881545 [Gymnopus androsaceus JB14]|uniref:G-protein coupled receptors family 2 profile 2 domain-containing protein n=1 Tax=Gymnopus androsaceus JB14 TaxID=1447944 RepID=A0A6A4HP73_9AGAR|nr:hypothetical protein BT96DRAFT_881545 [Gymnopus androsaceus JB14]
MERERRLKSPQQLAGKPVFQSSSYPSDLSVSPRSSTMAKFEFTPHMETVSNLTGTVTSAVGAGLCFLVLLVIGAVWLHPESRPHLDRVSFRIVSLLLANMLFGISTAVVGTMTQDGVLCGFWIFVLQLTLQISNFLLFCIALNLQLVVVHRFNGQKLEKFYIIFSFVVSAVLVIPPYASDQYGWDPLEQDCWYKNDNASQRMTWQISTQIAWTTLTAIGVIITSFSVMLFILMHHVRTRRVFVSTKSVSRMESSSHVLHAISYKRIILRIALYPMASCFVNLLSLFTAIYSMKADGIHNQTDYHILLLSDSLWGIRPILYALLAASDPALMRGVKTLYRIVIRRHPHPSDSPTVREDTADEGQSNDPVAQIELATIHDSFGSEREEDKSPKQTESGLGLGNLIADDRETPSTFTLQLGDFPFRRCTNIQRREEILQRNQLDFNKRI